MAQKESIIFRPTAKTKAAIKNELVGVFNSLFSYRKLKDSSLTFFPISVVLYLKINESIAQIHEGILFSYSLIEMSLMTSPI